MHILGSPDRIRSLHVFSTRLLAAAMLVTFALPAHSQGRERSVEHPIVYRTVQIDGLSIFYRTAWVDSLLRPSSRRQLQE